MWLWKMSYIKGVLIECYWNVWENQNSKAYIALVETHEGLYGSHQASEKNEMDVISTRILLANHFEKLYKLC